MPEPGATGTVAYHGRTPEKAKRLASEDISVARQHGWQFVNAVWRPQASVLARILVGPLQRFAPQPGILEVTYQHSPSPIVPHAPTEWARVDTPPPVTQTLTPPPQPPPAERKPRQSGRRMTIWPPRQPLRPEPLSSGTPMLPPVEYRVCGMCEAFASSTATRCPLCGHDDLLDRFGFSPPWR